MITLKFKVIQFGKFEMAKSRSYKLLCPIARALDRIGDRWTLLILRDLHAGPARFVDLQKGLTGIAANLLTERLLKLVADGLIEKVDGGHGATVYRLTDLGRRTEGVIFDLAMFGARFPPEAETVKPGNLRTVATTLGAAARRAAPEDLSLEVELIADDEAISLSVQNGKVEALYAAANAPDVVVRTTYLDLLAVTEGEIGFEDFATNRAEFEVRTPGKEQDLSRLMAAILGLLDQAA